MTVKINSHFDPISYDAPIYVAGHRGLVGSALVRSLQKNGYTQILKRTHQDLDLTRQNDVETFFAVAKPQFVFLAAAKVGGIQANATQGAEFIRTNLAIQTNVIHTAFQYGVKMLFFLGSSCIYPRDCPQPMKEEFLLTGPLEKTNEPYAVAKIAGLTMCEAYNRQYGTNFISVMPTNLYGPGDNFDLNSSHVIPALIRKIHEAKISGNAEVVIWGTGTPRREFLFVDDMADACVFLFGKFSPHIANGQSSLFNIGTGEDLTIRELAELICQVVGYEGRVKFDPAMPDGTPRKLLDVERLSNLGWHAKTGLEQGLAITYTWFLENNPKI